MEHGNFESWKPPTRDVSARNLAGRKETHGMLNVFAREAENIKSATAKELGLQGRNMVWRNKNMRCVTCWKTKWQNTWEKQNIETGWNGWNQIKHDDHDANQQFTGSGAFVFNLVNDSCTGRYSKAELLRQRVTYPWLWWQDFAHRYHHE